MERFITFYPVQTCEYYVRDHAFIMKLRAGFFFFGDRNMGRTVYSNNLLSFFGCNVQQERNWEFIMCIQCYIGNGKIAT